MCLSKAAPRRGLATREGEYKVREGRGARKRRAALSEAKESPRPTDVETAWTAEGGWERERERSNIHHRAPKIITHSPLRDLELPGCHFDTVRGIKDIPRSTALLVRDKSQNGRLRRLERRAATSAESERVLRRRDRLSRGMVCRTGEMRVATEVRRT